MTAVEALQQRIREYAELRHRALDLALERLPLETFVTEEEYMRRARELVEEEYEKLRLEQKKDKANS